MKMERINQIVAFWQLLTGRAAPKSIGQAIHLPGRAIGIFHLGRILISPIWGDDETVFHELAHLGQWQDGRLTYRLKPIVSAEHHPREVLQDAYHCYYVPRECALFEGRPVDEVDYEDRTVEVEARRLAAEWMIEFKRYEQQNDYAHC